MIPNEDQGAGAGEQWEQSRRFLQRTGFVNHRDAELGRSERRQFGGEGGNAFALNSGNDALAEGSNGVAGTGEEPSGSEGTGDDGGVGGLVEAGGLGDSSFSVSKSRLYGGEGRLAASAVGKVGEVMKRGAEVAQGGCNES